jgi:hypothetical protein
VDPKLKELVGRTNFGELVSPSVPQLDLNQPVASAPPPAEAEPIRSTVDPFQINFATVDIVGKFRDTRAGKGTKTFALLFLGIPMMLFGFGLVAMAWSQPGNSGLARLFASALGLGCAGFWPYVIYANRPRK